MLKQIPPCLAFMLPYGSLPGNEPSGNTVAAALGGPLVKDRLFFFASYEASERAFPRSLGFTSEAAKANLARLGFTGREIDVLPSSFNPQLWLLKLDWKPNAAHGLALRGNTFREFFAARDPGGTTVLSSSNGSARNWPTASPAGAPSSSPGRTRCRAPRSPGWRRSDTRPGSPPTARRSSR